MVSCRHDVPGSLEIFFDLFGKLYVSVLFVKVVVEYADFVVSYGSESIVNLA